MNKRLNAVGDRFGRLRIIGLADKPVRGRHWKCACDCGTVVVVSQANLRKGHSKSCGCLRAELAKAKASIHGHTSNGEISRTYRIWQGMHRRCSNPKDKAFPRYGAMGITVCERWKNFENFLADMGNPQPEMTLDRKENDRGYSPDNCRWVTKKAQNRNKKNSLMVTWRGRTQCLAAWAEELGFSRTCLNQRLVAGWSVEATLSTPRITTCPITNMSQRLLQNRR